MLVDRAAPPRHLPGIVVAGWAAGVALLGLELSAGPFVVVGFLVRGPDVLPDSPDGLL